MPHRLPVTMIRSTCTRTSYARGRKRGGRRDGSVRNISIAAVESPNQEQFGRGYTVGGMVALGPIPYVRSVPRWRPFASTSPRMTLLPLSIDCL